MGEKEKKRKRKNGKRGSQRKTQLAPVFHALLSGAGDIWADLRSEHSLMPKANLTHLCRLLFPSEPHWSLITNFCYTNLLHLPKMVVLKV